MEKKEPETPGRTKDAEPPAPSGEKKPWEEPKVAFVEPKLTRHGKLEKITRGSNGFFGVFSP
jgi:hypothetical protein